MVLEMGLMVETIYQMGMGGILLDWKSDIKQHNMIFIYIMGEISNYYIYGTFLFYGICKFKPTMDG